MKKTTRVERKRYRRKIMFRMVLMLTLITIGLAYAFKSEFFNIDNIIIDGDKLVSEETIITASAINKGENLFKVNTNDAEKYLEKLPYIKVSHIKRKPPNTINIWIEERVPVLQIKSLATYMLIDHEGIVLENQDKKSEILPAIVGYNITAKEPGQNIKEDELGIKLEDFFTKNDIINIIKKINTINVDLNEEINIDLNNGISVAFGPLDNVEYKLRLLDRILIDIENRQLKCKMIIMNKGENPILVLDNE
ncbi:FtsQ-type POTRA domain-containing protein [Tissierella creatinini]|nr:FtsQ-type POTRA domain-containing protein [Tissierella creatinini]TJX64427.1 FtsQ-type POTRA domain-containing protein [Soehngenia saccharolytica]